MAKENMESTEDFIDKLLEDDEFQEFNINTELVDKESGKKTSHKWEDDWDDEDAKDEFTLQLKKELENNSKKG